jgi:hypothetical protein
MLDLTGYNSLCSFQHINNNIIQRQINGSCSYEYLQDLETKSANHNPLIYNISEFESCS